MTDLNTLFYSLNSGEHTFADTLYFIEARYNYLPQRFNNGGIKMRLAKIKARIKH